MTNRINPITYKDVTIVFTDLSELRADDAVEVLKETLIEIPKHPKKSVYSLVDVKGMRFNPTLMKMFSTVGEKNQPYVIATAVSGLTSLTKLLAKGVTTASSRKADFFSEIEDAKEWLYLVSKGEK